MISILLNVYTLDIDNVKKIGRDGEIINRMAGFLFTKTLGLALMHPVKLWRLAWNGKLGKDTRDLPTF